jgi:hypothetical protein
MARMTSDTEAPKEEVPWNMLEWRDSIPLCDDLWLGMQAQNIAIVDRIVRHFEQQALDGFYDTDRFSMDDLLPLSAMSQVWVFALYEFLRTWLQRASTLIGYAEKLAALRTAKERAEYVITVETMVREKARHVKAAPVFYYEHIAKIGDQKFIKSIRDYRQSIKELFRDVEAIRIPLAKHEIAGSKNHKLFAEAPGYGRVNQLSGSMYWHVVFADGALGIIDRHSLADRFFGTERPPERSALFDDVKEPSFTQSAQTQNVGTTAPMQSADIDAPSGEEQGYIDWVLGKAVKGPQDKPRRRRGRRGGRRNRKRAKPVSLSDPVKAPASAPAKRRRPEGSGGGW